MPLHIISWNAFGIRHHVKLTALKTYVYRHHPQIIFIQEAFIGGGAPGEEAPPLSGYTSYVHYTRNSLITYIHSSLPHKLLRCSRHPDMTFQLFEVAAGNGKLRVCNVYSAPGLIHLPALPTPTDNGMIYMGDFNARHPALGDAAAIPNRSGTPLLNYINRYRLTRWDTGGATHSRGGTLDHILTSGLVASRVRCHSIPSLFSDHLAISLQYSLPSHPTPPHHHRTRISIPPKYCPTYISYISDLLHTFDLLSPETLYTSLVDATHNFFTRYVTKPHIRRHPAARTWTLDQRIAEAERIAADSGHAFQRQPTPDHLHQYQLARDDLITLQHCVQTESWQKYTDSINHQTSIGTMWHLINKTVKKKPTCALHHSPQEYANDLINTWSAQSQTCNLPAHIQESLSSERNIRKLRLMGALLRPDEDDDRAITEHELQRALTGSKNSSPGDDCITYQVLRLLQKVPGNPLLQLFNLCLRRGHIPSPWTRSTIVPIPKPGTDKFRPISLTSCFSKVFERILLARLMHRLQDKLSPSLYGFLPQRSTHHCLAELYTRLSPTSVVAFLDLETAFDIANKEIILDQLVEFGVQGNLLKWIRNYLSNRTSRVSFKGACSQYKQFELGTPQGGVLSPFLFNILMHRLLSPLPAIPGTTVTCYADDICIHSNSPRDLQLFLRDFYESSLSCGLIISSGKSRIFSSRDLRALPAFTMGGNAIPHCTQYTYLGAPARVTPAIPARQRIHPIVKDLLDRLELRFTPIKWLATNATGISIPVARTLYITFIRSVVDYMSPTLIQLPRKALEPLEKFQNRVMRFILGCPPSTRIVNMQSELQLPPLVARIFANMTYLSIKCLRYPHVTPHFSAVIRASLDPEEPRLVLRSGGQNLINAVCNNIRDLDINIPENAHDPGLPPWRIPLPAVTFTPTSKSAPSPLQKQLALETIDGVTSSVPAAHHIYVDGSVQADGSAACAIFSSTIEPPLADGWIGRRLPNSSSSTFCELHGILDAVTLLVQRRMNGVIVCDSQAALLALSAPRPSCSNVVAAILRQLASARDASLIVSLVWTPSHIGLAGNDTVDRLAKAACALDLAGVNAVPSTRCFRKRIYAAAHAQTVRRRDAERATSVSIQHHDQFLECHHKYRRHGLMVRRHNVVSARLRLGYRPVWQVAQADDMPQYSSCKLCDRHNANNLEHYCLQCPTVAHLLPRGQNLVNICKYLLTDHNLDLILTRHPHFGGC